MPEMRRLLCHRMPALNNVSRLPWIKGNIWKREHAPGVNPTPAPAPPLYGAEIDNYSTNFLRAYWNPAAHSGDLFDGQYHMMKFSLALSANPGGAVLADSAAVRALGGVSWFDNNGTLGKVILRPNNQPPGHEMTADEMADAIDAGTMFSVKPERSDLIIVGVITP